MTQFRINASQLLVSAVSAALLLLAPAVRADALQDISKQVKQGQHAQALEQVDKYLAGKPKDAQGRFLKGIILTEMNKPNEAIVVFTKLTEDYPELPEPYNNLAVIYSQQKQFDKAKQALEMAIRTHPSYATAHENLGDLYARLASQAYDKALQIDSSNSSAQKKLALIRDLMSTAGRPGKAIKPISDARPAKPVKIAEAPKSTTAAAPAVAAPAATPAPAAAEITRASDLRKVNATKTWIKVGTGNISMFRNPGKEEYVVVTFEQDYRSSNLSIQMKKRQYWVKEDGRWKIADEGAA